MYSAIHVSVRGGYHSLIVLTNKNKIRMTNKEEGKIKALIPHRGLSFNKHAPKKPWRATIYLGSFTDIKEASQAYYKAVEKIECGMCSSLFKY